MSELSPNATVGEEEIKRFRVGDILFSDEQAKIFCDLALKGLRAEGAIKTLPDAGLLVQRFETALQIAVTADLTPGGVSKARAKAVWDNADEKRSDLLKALTPSATSRITGIDVAMDAMRDAARYRWLRRNWASVGENYASWSAGLSDWQVDEQVDKEMGRE